MQSVGTRELGGYAEDIRGLLGRSQWEPLDEKLFGEFLGNGHDRVATGKDPIGPGE